MPVIDTGKLEELERKPGWRGRYFDSPSMTFGHYDFDEGAAWPVRAVRRSCRQIPRIPSARSHEARPSS